MAPVAWAPVGTVAVGVAVLLLSLAGRYGYHRDELYFRLLGQHLEWGYLDQPPLTPLLGRMAIAVFGDTVWAIRVPPALLVALAAVLLALVARELGGGASAQVLAAFGATTCYMLASGHTLFTNAPDLVIWILVSLFALRALLHGRPGYWLAVGATVGAGLYNKYLVIILLVSLAAGILLVGPRRVLVSRWLWAGAAVAAVVSAPNLVYQAVNGWPQIEMASAISHHEPGKERALLLPMQLVLLVGPVLAPVWIAGIAGLLRRRQWRPVRAFAVAYPLLCLLVLALPGHYYYPTGLLYVLYAAGCVPVGAWLAARPQRRILVGAAVAVNVGISIVLTMPILPITAIVGTPIPQINQVIDDQIGWPGYVRQIAEVYGSLPSQERAAAVIITDNYGEAGAVDRYGARYHLPQVYSGHNELYYLHRPPPSATVAVLVVPGGSGVVLAEAFERCEVAGELRNDTGIESGEDGVALYVCRQPRRPWNQLWPRFRHH